MPLTPEQKRLLEAVIEEAIWAGRAAGEQDSLYRDPPRSRLEIEERIVTFSKQLGAAQQKFLDSFS